MILVWLLIVFLPAAAVQQRAIKQLIKNGRSQCWKRPYHVIRFYPMSGTRSAAD
jgi:hypothetical protein